MNRINQSNFIRAINSESKKNQTNHFTPFKCHFVAATMAEIKQVFKVEKFNPQQEEIIKSLFILVHPDVQARRSGTQCRMDSSIYRKFKIAECMVSNEVATKLIGHGLIVDVSLVSLP